MNEYNKTILITMIADTLSHQNHQSGTKPNLVAKILATNFGVFF